MNREYEEYIREKTKPMRRKSIKTLKQQAPKAMGPETTSIASDVKEVKFLNFVKKMEEVDKQPPLSGRRITSAKTYSDYRYSNWDGSGHITGRILSTIKSQTDRVSTCKTEQQVLKSRVSTNLPLVTDRTPSAAESPSIDIQSVYKLEKREEVTDDVQIVDDKSVTPDEDAVVATTPAIKSIEASPTEEQQTANKSVDVLSDNVSDYVPGRETNESNDQEIKQIEMYQCLADDAIMCECFINNNTHNEHPTTPMTPQNDIFHLTAGDEDENVIHHVKKHRSIDFTQEEAELIPQSSLRDILLNNYDPKFAKKIGITDFVPVEVMNGQNDPNAKPLEFIPFENIDRNYPK